MSSYRLAEGTQTTIRDYIRANIAARLAEVAADHTDGFVSLEAPPHRSYFNYASAQGYAAPAVFILVPKFDLRLDKGQNSIAGIARTLVGILVEDKDHDRLTVKTWRYGAAMAKLFTSTAAPLLSGDNTVKLFPKLRSLSYSPPYHGKDAASPWRMEVVLELEVEHLEQL